MPAQETDVRTLLADATARLAAAGVGSPRVDAELLLARPAGRSARPAADSQPGADLGRASSTRTTSARRIAREPLQHITGRAAFRNLDLEVGPGVFIPRPETELLVDAVLPDLARLTPTDRGGPLRRVGRARARHRRRGRRRARRRRRAVVVRRAVAGPQRGRDGGPRRRRVTCATRNCCASCTARSTWSSATRPTSPPRPRWSRRCSPTRPRPCSPARTGST